MLDKDKILEIGVPLIKKFEGLRLEPYLDTAGIPTIGYGSTRHLDGTKVTMNDPPITEEQAEELLCSKIESYFLPEVLRLCPTLENESQAAAILSWTYNLGPGNLEQSTMRKRILEEDWDSVPEEMLKWNKSGGKIIKGLVTRRNKESCVFKQGNSDGQLELDLGDPQS